MQNHHFCMYRLFVTDGACSFIQYIFHNFYYRPQRSCEGYVFTLVCHSVHRGGVCLSECWDTTTPREQAPPQEQAPLDQVPPGTRHPPRTRHPPGPGTPPPPGQRQLLLRTVRILLECILVQNKFVPYLIS